MVYYGDFSVHRQDAMDYPLTIRPQSYVYFFILQNKKEKNLVLFCYCGILPQRATFAFFCKGIATALCRQGLI